MESRCARPVALALAMALVLSRHATAQTPRPPVALIVQAGRPLRLALDAGSRVRGPGQRVTATVLEPVYAVDRIVVPAGTTATGHIERVVGVSKQIRLRSLLAGDLTPMRGVLLQFDGLTLTDGRTIPIQTFVAPGAERIVLRVADAPSRDSAAARAREHVAQQVRQAVSVVRGPGKWERLRDMAVRSLPYRPQFLRKGTVYSAVLAAPLEFGAVAPTESAPATAMPAPDSILNARLLTALSSGATSRGAPIDAVLTQPVFDADHRLILPEGTRLAGVVTLARPARRFHRNGQLRFLFERVVVEGRAPETLLASLYSVESQGGDRLSLDEEGGARMTNSKTRFVAPALGALALVGVLHSRLETDTEGPGPETQSGGIGSSTVGGWLGLGILGAGISQVSRPLSVTLTAVGFARSTYSSVFGRGRDVSFPADTPIQVQLAAGAGARRE